LVNGESNIAPLDDSHCSLIIMVSDKEIFDKE